MQSVSVDGFAQIITFFVFSKGEAQASQDVRDAISNIRGDLPSEIEEPIISRFSTTDLPIVSLTLSSPTLTQAQLTSIADPGITRELRSLPGVASVSVVGGAVREMTVELKPDALRASGISVGEVVGALQSQNVAAPVGRVTGQLDERTIRLEGRLSDPADFMRLVVAERGGRIIRLAQVADVRDGVEEARSAAIFNGKPAIGIDIRKTAGASTTTVSDQIKERIDKLRPTLPEGAHIDIVTDAGERVSDSVRNVEEMLVEGALLTILVVFFFLNSWRSTVITGLALPISVLSAFIAVWVFGFTLNTMSLLGLSLAIGVLIDDAIVVRENIVRHIQMGKGHYKAAHDGTHEIGLAVAATTFSITAVFIPIAFMPGQSGQWFKPMGLTMACAVLVSLFVSFSLDPMLSAYWADPQLEKGERRNPVARLLNRFNDWFERQADNYKGVIAWALDHRLAMVIIATGTMVVALFLQVRYGGFGFVPNSDRSELNIGVETPPGSNLEYTRIKAEEVARVLRTHPEVAYTYVTVGSGGDMMGGAAVDKANIYLRMVPKSQRHISQYAFAGRVRDEIRTVGGAKAWVFSSGFGGNQKELQIELRGPDARVLTDLGEQVAAIVEQVPNAVDVGLSTRGQKPELNVRIDRGMAGTLGVTAGQIAMALRPAFAGIDAGDWIDPDGETRDVMVRLSPESRRRAEDIRQLPLVLAGGTGGAPRIVSARTGRQCHGRCRARADRPPRSRSRRHRRCQHPGSFSRVLSHRTCTPVWPMSAATRLHLVARRIRPAAERVLLQHLRRTRLRAAAHVPDPRRAVRLVRRSDRHHDVAAALAHWRRARHADHQHDAQRHEPHRCHAAHGYRRQERDPAHRFREVGPRARNEPREALIEAGRIRLRPILMTSFALIAGMSPVALGLGEGADFRAPMGRAVIGGVITSTLLTLIVIPTVYEILDEFKEWVMLKTLGRKPSYTHSPESLVPEAGD